MKAKLDGVKVRDWLRNFFQSEKTLVMKYLKLGNESKARDCLTKDSRILYLLHENGMPMGMSNLHYHRNMIMSVPGQRGRFPKYQAEFNGNQTAAK